MPLAELLQQHQLGGPFLAARTAYPLIYPLRLFTTNKTSTSLIEECRKANQSFLALHDTLAKTKIQHINHFVIYLNGELLLMENKNGQYHELDRLETEALMEPYILNKTLLHKMTGIFMIWKAVQDDAMSFEQMRKALIEIEKEMKAIAVYLPANNDIYQVILKPTLSMIEEANKANSKEAINRLSSQYFLKMQEVIFKLGESSTKLQLEKINEIMNKWMTEHTLDIAALRVLVVGAEGPRQGHIETQYFQHLGHHSGVEEFVHYVESPQALMGALTPQELIHDHGKYLLNQDIAQAVLGDREAMKKDVLRTHAAGMLREMSSSLPGQASTCPLGKK